MLPCDAAVYAFMFAGVLFLLAAAAVIVKLDGGR